MTKSIKNSVAVAIFNGDRILSTRRSDDDEELPGIWGLPAGTYRAGETLEDLIHRIGRDKLGVKLKRIRKLNRGAQDRPSYQLNMELWEASMEGLPARGQWRWAPTDSLQTGAEAGSLCCSLVLSMRGGGTKV